VKREKKSVKEEAGNRATKMEGKACEEAQNRIQIVEGEILNM